MIAFTLSVQETKRCVVEMDRKVAKLSSDFIASVQSIDVEVQDATVSCLEDMSDVTKQSVLSLIEKYGTHCIQKLSLGGVYTLATGMTEQDVKSNLGDGFYIKQCAEVAFPGTSVTGLGEDGFEILNETLPMKSSSSLFCYRGGRGGLDEWYDGDLEGAQPVDMQLSSIDEILTEDAFPAHVLDPAKLTCIQNCLKLFISARSNEYIPEKVKLPPIVYVIRAKYLKLTDASRHEKSLAGTLSLSPSPELNKFNSSSEEAEKYVLFERSAAEPYDWYNEDEYRFSEYEVPFEFEFHVPFSDAGRNDLYITIQGDLGESDKDGRTPDPYHLDPFIIGLGAWTSDQFDTVLHEAEAYNRLRKEGIVHVVVETEIKLDMSSATSSVETKKSSILRVTAKRIELTDASRHEKSLAGSLYMNISDGLEKYNIEKDKQLKHKLFERSEAEPHDWYSGDTYEFDEKDVINEWKFVVPEDEMGNEELYVTVEGDLGESDKNGTTPDPYSLESLKIDLKATQKEKVVVHETVGYNRFRKDGIVHVYVETEWINEGI